MVIFSGTYPWLFLWLQCLQFSLQLIFALRIPRIAILKLEKLLIWLEEVDHSRKNDNNNNDIYCRSVLQTVHDSFISTFVYESFFWKFSVPYCICELCKLYCTRWKMIDTVPSYFLVLNINWTMLDQTLRLLRHGFAYYKYKLLCKHTEPTTYWNKTSI